MKTMKVFSSHKSGRSSVTLVAVSVLSLLRRHHHGADAFGSQFTMSFQRLSPLCTTVSRGKRVVLQLSSSSASSSSWSTGDDWNQKSKEEARALEAQDIFMQDFMQRAVNRIEEEQQQANQFNGSSDEDAFLVKALETLQQHDDFSDSKLLDDDDRSAQRRDTPEDQEVAMLIRCNDQPQQILLQNNLLLLELDPAERDDIQQLVNYRNGTWSPTSFLKSSVQRIFQLHATMTDSRANKHESVTTTIMDRSGIRDWLQQSLGDEEEGYIGMFDTRIATLVSLYGTAQGLTADNLLELYLSTLVGDGDPKKIVYRNEELRMVWRDLRNHGIVSPNQTEYQSRLEELRRIHDALVGDDVADDDNNIMDECEILDYNPVARWEKDDDGRWEVRGKSSHQRVEMAADAKTPLYLQDGDFVFIDEESCIGCMQCVTAAPSSFQMTDSGRARTFDQRMGGDVSAAVASCPVNCMHNVGFERLEELEIARDSLTGDGRTDHKHFGPSAEDQGKWFTHTPLHVSGRDSDASHKSSWYHYFVNKCFRSNQCPQRGCFDCPRFRGSGEVNPFCLGKAKLDYHVRAQTFIKRGDADRFRKTVDL